jgi:hypothetical protein
MTREYATRPLAGGTAWRSIAYPVAFSDRSRIARTLQPYDAHFDIIGG